MLSLLRFIGDGIVGIGKMVLWALVTGVNAIIEGVGALIALVLSLLPSLPAPPNIGGSGILELFAWLMPLGAMAAFFTVLITAWLAFLVVRIALNWVKAL